MPHFPVLLRETINLLALQPGDKIIDATFGDGGHSREILNRIRPNGRLLGLDADSENIESGWKNKDFESAVLAVGNFADLERIARARGFFPADKILMDLGWSRTQFEKSGRGFSFLRNEPLDMRYEAESGKLTAAEILNVWTGEEIGRILRECGEEENWREIARAIIAARRKKTIETTFDLVSIVGNLKLKIKNFRLHPATKIFQALRIAVNDEFGNLKKALPRAISILKPEGRLAVITFHSSEDRIVKQFFKSQKSLKIINKKPVIASRAEVKANPPSRGAKLRVAEKSGGAE